MGRHALPESDFPTEVIAVPNDHLGREIDLGLWWGAVTPNGRAWVAIAAVVLCVLGFLAISASSGPTAEERVISAAASARSAGADYGDDLRDRGYNSTSIYANCSINNGGYQGSYFEDYMDGCMTVVLQQMRKGR